jgi:pre-mRNA-processing factor 6
MRSKRRRELKEEEEKKKAKLDNSSISVQFADLKRDLAQLTEDEWGSIPDIGDRSLKYKQDAAKHDKFVPVPDNIIAMGGAIGSAVSLPSSSASGSRGGGGGGGGGGIGGPSMATTDIRGLAAARGQMLQLNLTKMSDSVSGQTNVDPRGYMTGLNSLDIASDANVKDIKKARLLLRSVTMSNPRHGPGWVAAARLEEQVKELAEARRLIKEGCENCPQDEDVWVEAVRLQGAGGAKLVLADAVRHVPRSIKLWMATADLEGEDNPAAKKAVLRKALSRIPDSETLWKAAVSLETPDDAKILLSRAVECVPQSIDLWLALARLESYKNAQKVLNDARKA